jgi:hypothetical protein
MMKYFNIQNRVGCSALMRGEIHSQSPALAFFRLAKQLVGMEGIYSLVIIIVYFQQL